MKRNQLIKEICRREGKSSQTAIGNVREIIAVIEDIIAEETVKNGTTVLSSQVVALLEAEAQKKVGKMSQRKMKQLLDS